MYIYTKYIYLNTNIKTKNKLQCYQHYPSIVWQPYRWLMVKLSWWEGEVNEVGYRGGVSGGGWWGECGGRGCGGEGGWGGGVDEGEVEEGPLWVSSPALQVPWLLKCIVSLRPAVTDGMAAAGAPTSLLSPAQPSECGRQRTLNCVHGHTASRLQSNGNLAVWMSQISTEWRECSINSFVTD